MTTGGGTSIVLIRRRSVVRIHDRPSRAASWGNSRFPPFLERSGEGDQCGDFGIPNVIAFTGYECEGISLREGAENTIAGMKELAAYAAPRNVTVVLDDSDPELAKQKIYFTNKSGKEIAS